MGSPVTRRSALPLGTPPSHVCSTDPRLWYVSPSQLCGRRDLPISLSSPALEQLVVQLAAVSRLGGRSLYEEERRIIHEVFEDSVDLSRVYVVEARVANAPTTLGNQIRVTPGFDFLTNDNKAVLVHEMTHVWQFQTHGPGYITDALYHQLSSMIRTGDRNSAYMNYDLSGSRSFSSYPAEEQATILQDYYELVYRYADDPHAPAWVSERRPGMPEYERLVHEVRSYVPLSDVQIYEGALMGSPGSRFSPLNDVPERQIAPLIPILMLRF